jgi:hypothetical protein
LDKYYVWCANMSTETALNDVSNVASRLQGLRLATPAEDERDATENATAAGSSSTTGGNVAEGAGGGGSGGSGGGPSSSREPLRNITLSRARRALNFVGDEDQPLLSSSSAVRSEASNSNSDK